MPLKKTIILLVIVATAAALFTACSSDRKAWGCPTTNPRYFRI